MTIEIEKNSIILRLISNYLETGVMLDDEIPDCFGRFLKIPDQELYAEFKQSCILRETFYAINHFRTAN